MAKSLPGRVTVEKASGVILAVGGGFPMWVGTTEATNAQTALWSNGWVRLAAVLWVFAIALVAISWGRQGVVAVTAWWHHRGNNDNDGDDDVTKPKKKGPTPKRGSNAAIQAKRVQQGDHNTNIGQQNNFAAPVPPMQRPTRAAIYVEGGTDNVISDNKAFGYDTPYVDIGGTRNTWERNEAVAPTVPKKEGSVPQAPDAPIESGPTAELMEKLLQVPKEEADEVHREHDQP